MTRLAFVRHGHAQAAERGVVGGHKGCTGLTERGRQQAGRLRDRFVHGGFRPDVIVTSVLPRAIETAHIIAAGLELDAQAIPQDCDLCERHPGEGDGLTWSAFVERYGAIDPITQPDLPPSPGGESANALKERVGAAVERLVKEHHGLTVLVVSHGGVIVGVTELLLGLPPQLLTPDIPHTSITEWIYDEDDGWLLGRFNDAAHLEGSST